MQLPVTSEQIGAVFVEPPDNDRIAQLTCIEYGSTVIDTLTVFYTHRSRDDVVDV